LEFPLSGCESSLVHSTADFAYLVDIDGLADYRVCSDSVLMKETTGGQNSEKTCFAEQLP
jgi:hypothetical protein